MKATHSDLAGDHRGCLESAAQEQSLTNMEALQSLLTSHVLHADRQAQALAARSEELLAFLFATPESGDGEGETAPPPDPAATLEVIARLNKLYASYAGEFRKSVELMDRLSRPRSPSLQVVAAGEQVNVAGAQQINNDRRARSI